MAETKYETDYQRVKAALGDRDPIADLAALNRQLERRSIEARALKQFLVKTRDLVEDAIAVHIANGDHPAAEIEWIIEYRELMEPDDDRGRDGRD